MDDSNCSRAMPRYKCHKEVWALKIAGVDIREDKSAVIAPADEGYGVFQAKPGWADRFRGTEDDPGYYVVYDDGYASWSPSKAFEDGYTRV